MDLIEENLKAKLQKVQAASSSSQPENSSIEHNEVDTEAAEEASRSALLEKLENKKKELVHACSFMSDNKCYKI